MAKTARKPTAAKRPAKQPNPKAKGKAPSKASIKAAEKEKKAKEKALREQAKMQRWNRDGITTVDGTKMIGEMVLTKFNRLVKDVRDASRGGDLHKKDVKLAEDSFKDSGGDLWALKQVLSLAKKDAAVIDHRLRHFIMYALQMELPAQPDMFVGVNDGLPSLKSAAAMGEMCGADGGNIKSNPFNALAEAFDDAYKAKQKEMAEKIGKPPAASKETKTPAKDAETVH